MCGLPHGLSAEPVDKTNDNDVCIFRVQFSVCLSELEDPESYIFNGFVAIGEYIIVLLSPYLLVCFCLLLFFTSLESQCLMINTGLFKVFCLCSLKRPQFFLIFSFHKALEIQHLTLCHSLSPLSGLLH